MDLVNNEPRYCRIITEGTNMHLYDRVLRPILLKKEFNSLSISPLIMDPITLLYIFQVKQGIPPHTQNITKFAYQ